MSGAMQLGRKDNLVCTKWGNVLCVGKISMGGEMGGGGVKKGVHDARDVEGNGKTCYFRDGRVSENWNLITWGYTQIRIQKPNSLELLYLDWLGKIKNCCPHKILVFHRTRRRGGVNSEDGTELK